MNNSQNYDSFDALLYSAMKYVGETELEEYNSACDDIVFSPKAKARLIKRLMRYKNYVDNHKVYRPAKEMFKRIAVALLVAATLLFSACMCVEKIREAVFDIVTQWYERFITVEVISIHEEQVDDNGNIINPPETILVKKEPVMDDGFEKFVVQDINRQYYLEYEKDDILIAFRQTPFSDYAMLISNNDTEMLDVTINENNGKYTQYTANGTTEHSLIWTDGQYCYRIVGNISKEEAVRIAETIK